MQASEKLSNQSTHFSRVLTSYLAMTSVQYLINEDVLGINVILSRMQSQDMFDFASVYDLNDQLVAQVGQRHSEAVVFNQQITFQDSTAGYIQVGYNNPPSYDLVTGLVTTVISIHLLLAGLALACIWLLGDLIVVWLYRTGAAEKPAPEPEEEASQITLADQGALLVFKLEPVRLTSKHRDLMNAAIALYGGRSESHPEDDLTVEFRQENAAFNAICAGLLISALVTKLGPPLKFKVGIHWSEDFAEPTDEQGLKQTSYLASISDQAVLVSKAFQQILNDDRVRIEPYRSSLAPDGAVFEVAAVSNQALIEGQAEQLLNRR